MIAFGFFKKCLLLLSLTFCLVWYWLTSSSGLFLSYRILASRLPGKLEIQDLQGRLIDNIQAKKIIYQQEGLTLVIDNLSIRHVLHFPGLNAGTALIKGHITAEKIIVDNLFIHEFKGNFSGNSLKTILARAQFKGQYADLRFDGKLDYQQQLQAELVSGNNNLRLQGQFPYPWKAEARISEPALLHPELAGLSSSITANASLASAHQGKLQVALPEGYLNTKAIQGFHFLGADLQANLSPQGIESKGLIHIDKERKFTFNLDFPQFKRWKGEGNLYSRDKSLSLKGQGNMQPHFEGKIDLQGSDFPLIETSEYKIWLSPALQAVIAANRLTISGNILVPRAQIIPIGFEDSLVLSDDVAFVGLKDQPLPFNVAGDVNLVMGEAVFLEIKGLKTGLTGSINLNKTLQGPVTATGQLQVKDGKYKAYGQDLDIQQGQLLFTGGLVTNPGIQLKAAKTITNFDDLSSNNPFGNKITVGVEVSGWLNAPKIALFANPAALSQADILSLLILGHRASEAGKSGGQLLLAAIRSMNLGSGSKGAQLLEQVKNSLGIDVNVKSSKTYNQKTNTVKDNTGLEIGKSLSRRLYVSYNRGLTMQADANVLTLKYLLTKFFSLQVTASDAGNGIDLLYSSQKDEKNAK